MLRTKPRSDVDKKNCTKDTKKGIPVSFSKSFLLYGMQASFELSQIRIEQQTQFSSNDLLVIHCLGVGRGSTLGKNCFVIPDKKVCFRFTLKLFLRIPKYQRQLFIAKFFKGTGKASFFDND